MKQLIWLSIISFHSFLGLSGVMAASSPISPRSISADEAPTCYDIQNDSDSTTINHLSAGQQWLVFDDFKQPHLAPEYQIHYGRGSYALAHDVSRDEGALVYELPLSANLVGEADILNLTADEALGRAFGPSVLVARSWAGDQWIFDTKITYGWVESCNGCDINLWIAFDGVIERHRNSIKLTRFLGDSNHGDNLTLTVYDNLGNSIRTARAALNSRELYFLRLIRNGQTVEVLISNDGASYSQVLSHSFTAPLEQKRQWMIVNSLAFKGGCAYAAFHYVTVRSPIQGGNHSNRPSYPRWKIFGGPDRRVELTAKEIEQALRDGKDIDIRFARVTGELNFSRVQQKTISNQIVFRDSEFVDSIIGSDITFGNDVVFENCDVKQPVQLFNSTFDGRTDFSNSIFESSSVARGIPLLFSGNRFKQGADFTSVTFQTKPVFRTSHFDMPVSFWLSNFDKGSDFSDTVFLSDVTFTDFSFSTLDTPSDSGSDMLFFGSSICGRILFNVTFDRTNPPLGHEISFQNAQINEFAFGSGTPNAYSIEGQEGPAVWVVTSGLSLREAKVKKILFKDVAFISRTVPVDLQELSFEFFGSCGQVPETSTLVAGPKLALVNIDFANFLMSDWPVGNVLADERSSKHVIAALESTSPALARLASFDLAPVSHYYDEWRRDSRKKQGGEREQIRYDGYPGYRFEQLLLHLFWITSGYGTSFWFTLRTGLMLTAGFACIFLALDRGRGYLLRIEKPLELKTRISETPILSLGESPEATNKQLRLFAVARRKAQGFGRWEQGAILAFLFSINMILKIGFGNIRLRVSEPTPRGLVTASWLAWSLGYCWYLLLVYTIAVIPLLKGLAK